MNKQEGVATANSSHPRLKVYGTWFASEFRTICQILDLNNIEYKKDTDLDIFTQKGLDDYKSFNPAQTMPTLLVGNQSIVGDAPTLYRYVCMSFPVETNFYPHKQPAHEVKRRNVDKFLDHITYQLKITCSRIVKLHLKKVAVQKRKAPAENVDLIDEQIALEVSILNDQFLQQIEDTLELTKQYLTGYDYSVADIAYYNELINVHSVAGKKLEHERFPNTSAWIKRMEGLTPVRQGKKAFEEQLERLK